MIVYINGEQMNLEGSFSNIGHIIDRLVHIVNANKHTIVKIYVDEHAIDYEDKTFLAQPYTSQNIYIITEETDKVFVRSIQESVAFIEHTLLPEIQALSRQCRSGIDKEAHKRLSALIDSFYWLLDLLDFVMKQGFINDFGIKSSEFQVHDLKSFITDITQAASRQDNVLIADLLQYEIHPLMTTWFELLTHLKELT